MECTALENQQPIWTVKNDNNNNNNYNNNINHSNSNNNNNNNNNNNDNTNLKPKLHACSLSAYNLILWWLSLQTGSKCTNRHWPSSLPLILLFQLPITMQTRASLHSYEFPTVTWLWRWLPLWILKRQTPPVVFLRTPFTRMIKFHRGNE